ncbi:MAG: ParB N-terminal domain-containing protein [Proteobacteria bacterium]|nr:ParB N-terminal domain-containing protein [Pseudomonadota bacterium]MBU1584385.1 ParB N-terminal domain-containing protein [Pseudomonadota bacterium]MBU2451972.1 ParB N-terminal domain-containing protein [Pseudomonadota bacterium]MBU2630948.1 ParB N-terminal domain-containing protein [Pseudomonadota bacterium]
MFDTFCEIRLLDIDLSDERYKISLSKDDITFLALSIKEAGLINPPIVRPLNKKFIIISGFNRVRALIYNKASKIVVYQTKKDESDYQCLLTSIAALSFKRPLTHSELIVSTKKLYEFIDKNEIAKKSSAIFNTKLNPQFVETLLSIGALPDPILELLDNGNLSFNSAKRICAFEKETVNIFLIVFSKVKASNSIQLEIIQHFLEICARDAINPIDFFNSKEIQEFLFNETKDPGIRTHQLRTWLYKHRFPTLFKTRQMVQEKIAAINFGNAIKFLSPQNFEGQDYSISFTAKTYDEFKANTHHLTTALENKSLKEIFDR